MARVARIIAEGHPHHITQRGNRRQRTFFGDEDYAAYLHLMAEWCKKCDIAVWAVTDWPTFLSDEEEAAELTLLRRHALPAARWAIRGLWRGWKPCLAATCCPARLVGPERRRNEYCVPRLAWLLLIVACRSSVYSIPLWADLSGSRGRPGPCKRRLQVRSA